MADEYAFKVRFDFVGNAGEGVAQINKAIAAVGRLDQSLSSGSQRVAAFGKQGIQLNLPNQNITNLLQQKRQQALQNAAGAAQGKGENVQAALQNVQKLEGYLFRLGQLSQKGVLPKDIQEKLPTLYRKVVAEYLSADKQLEAAQRAAGATAVSLEQKVSGEKIAIKKREVAEEQAIEKEKQSTAEDLGKASSKHSDAGLGAAPGPGADLAKQVMSLVQQADQGIFQISQKVRSMLPAAEAEALDKIGAQEQAAIQASLERAINEAAEKKAILEKLVADEAAANQRLTAAEANASAHPRSKKASNAVAEAKAEAEAISTARQQAETEALDADQRANRVAVQAAEDVKTRTVAAARDKAQAEKQAQAEIEAEDRKWAQEAKELARELAQGEKQAAKEKATADKQAAAAAKQAAKDKTTAEKQAQAEAKKSADAEKKSAKEAEAAITSFTNGVKSKISAIGQILNGVTQSLNRFTNGFRLVAQGIQEVGNAIAIYVAAPLALMEKEGISTALAWEQQWAKVKKALDMPALKENYTWLQLSAKEMEKLTIPELQTKAIDTLEQRFRNLAKITPTTIEQLGAFAEQAAQVGIQGGPAIYRFVNLVNKMVIGTDVAADTVTEDLARIAGAYGKNLNTEEGMQWAENLASVMDLVAKRTSTDMQGIMTAMKDAAVVGPMLKMSADQIAAALGVLISSGVDPSAAGTILTRFYKQVLSQTDNFVTAMKGYKRQLADGSWVEPYKNAGDVMKALNSEPVVVLTDTIKALNEATDDTHAQALANFYDAAGQVGGRIGAMAGNYSSLTDMLKAASQEMNHAGELQKDYNAMLQTGQAQVDIFKNNMRDLGMTLAGALMPTMNRLIGYAIPAIQALGKAFMGLNDKTKLLVVGIPLLVVAGTPVLMLFGALAHAAAVLAMALVTTVMGFGNLATGVIGAASKLGLITKLFGGAASAGTAAAEGVAAVGEGAVAATGGFATFFSAIATWIAANPITTFALGFIAVFKILSQFGLDVGKYFIQLSESAKAWGENLMITYGDGLLGGAARVISSVVSTIAGWIASFFEAHSPPKVGPLSTIDQWGKTLMNTYLKGFFLADFSILSDVGSLIKQALTDVAELGGGSFADFGNIFMQWREDIAQVIDIFNKTGKVAEDVLSRIGSNLGSLGKDIQELVRDWLAYNKLQKELDDLEKKRTQTETKYDDQIDAIARRTDISAEEKAELIRQATMNKNKELDQIDEEKKKTQDALDDAKEKLDWQKEYVKAQLEELDLLREIKNQKDKKDAGGGGGAGPVKFDPTKGLGGGGNPVKDLGEEFNKVSENIENARKKVNEFFNALQGKKFGDGLSQADMDKWAKEDPAGFKEAKDLYDMGIKAHDTWQNLQGPLTKIGQLLGIIKTENKETAKAQSPLIEGIQKLMDSITKLANAGDNLNSIFGGPMQAWLNDLGKTWDNITGSTDRAGTAMDVLSGIVTGLAGALWGIGVAIFNGLGTALGWIGVLLVQVVDTLATFVGGVFQVGKGIVEIFVGIYEGITKGDFSKVGQGVKDIIMGLLNTFWSLLNKMGPLAATVFTGVLDIIIGLLGDIGAVILKLLGQEQLAAKWKEITANAQVTLRQLYAIVVWAFTWIKETVRNIVSALFDGKTWAAVGAWFAGIWKGIVTWFNGLGPAIGKAVSNAWNGAIAWLSGLGAKIGTSIKIAWFAAIVYLTTMKTLIVERVKLMWAAAIVWMQSLKQLIAAKIKEAWQGALDFIKSLPKRLHDGLLQMAYEAGVGTRKVVDFFKSLPERIRTAIKNLWEAIKSRFTEAWTGLTNWWNTTWPQVVAWFQGLPQKIADGLKDLWTIISTKFTELWTGLTNWWNTNWPIWVAWFASLPGKAWDALKDLAKQLGDALDRGWKSFTTWASEKGTAFWNWFAGLPGRAWNALQTLGANLSSALNGAWKSVEQWFTDHWSTWEKKVGEFVTRATTALSGLGKAMADAVNTGLPDLLKAMDGLISAAWEKFKKFLQDMWEKFLKGYNGSTDTSSSSTKYNNDGSVDHDNNPSTPYALGGVITHRTKALIGEAGMPEAVIPLNRLPALMHQMYGGDLAGGLGGGGSMTINIHNPVVREEQDIKKIAKEVRREIETAMENKRRMRGG